jgi:cytochrome P450
VTMLLAAHETTANAMAFSLGLLARHPSVLRRLRQEVTAVLGDGPATAASLDKMPLLEAVVREAMRLYPPAWILSRSAEQDTTVAGQAIPKGSVLFVPIYGVHRVPSVWEDPEAFDPERWLDGRGERARKQNMYLPFGMGQRRCVGEHLAMLEARLVLATLVRKMHLALVPGQTLEAEVSVTLRPRGGLWMTARSLSQREESVQTPLPPAPAGRCPVHHAP